MIDYEPFYRSKCRANLIDKTITSMSCERTCERCDARLRGFNAARRPQPGWAAKCQHDNAVRLSFRAAERGTCDPRRSADAGSSPRAVGFSEPAILEWCPRPDSNRHSSRNRILNPARLPIPPLGHGDTPITASSKHTTAKAKYAAYFVAFAAFFRAVTDMGRVLRTLTAEASILFFKCRP